MIAFNLLRTIGQQAIKRAHLPPIQIKVSRWRLRTVLQNIIYCAARVVSYQRITLSGINGRFQAFA